MAVEITKEFNVYQIQQLIGEGWVSLALFSSDNPEGPFTNTSVTPDPATLAAAITAEEYTFTWEVASGNPSQWFKVLAFDGSGYSDKNQSDTFHGGGGTALKRIRQKTGAMLRCLEVGHTTSVGTTTTAICNESKFKRRRDNYYGGSSTGADGWIFHRISTGEWSEITAWDQSAGEFTFSPAFATSVQGSEEFEVIKRWTPDELRDAINWATVNVFPRVGRPMLEEGYATVEDVYSYIVPNDMINIHSVEYSLQYNDSTSPSGQQNAPWKNAAYVILDDGMQRSIEFKLAQREDVALRIKGWGLLSQMYEDTDATEISEPQIDLIAYKASHRLYAILSNDAPSNDVARFRDQATYFEAMFNEKKSDVAMRRPVKKIFGHDAKWGNT